VTVERESQAWALRQQGWTQQAIADELGIAQQTVAHILKRVERRVLKELSAEVARFKARQTAQLEAMLHEAMRAWEKSLVPATVLVKRQRPHGGDEEGAEEIVQEIRDQFGNPAFLQEAMAALAAIRKIWGLDAAEPCRPAAPAVRPIVITNVAAGCFSR
jgi:hypothetical protein